jgi:RNA polymerase sigma-70 factor (ECF subfamily)
MSDDRSDAGLVTRAKAGDQEAFASLFLYYKLEIYRYLMNVVRSDEMAKDLFQDTYLKAWNNIQRLRDPSKFKRWLLTIARNLAFDQLRRHPPERIRRLEEHGGTLDSTDNVIQRECVLYILAMMKPVYREILLLDAQGYSRDEIAHELGYKASTVRVYLLQARQQARHYRHMMDNIDET